MALSLPAKLAMNKYGMYFFNLEALENKSFFPVYLIDTVIRLNQNIIFFKLT